MDAAMLVCVRMKKTKTIANKIVVLTTTLPKRMNKETFLSSMMAVRKLFRRDSFLEKFFTARDESIQDLMDYEVKYPRL